MSEFTMLESGITDTPNRRIGLIKTTTDVNRIMAKIDTFIGKYGLIPSGLFQKGMKYIIRKMSLITILKTLHAYLKSGIIYNILYLNGNASGCVNMSRIYDQRQPCGINQKKAGNGTDNTPKIFIRNGSHSLNSVSNAVENSKTLQGNQQPGFAQMPVNQNGAENQRLTMRSEYADGAARNFQPISIVSQRPVPVHVLSVLGVHQKKQPVFDITVDGLPEFYANGILVHNSMDSRRYAVMLITEPPEPQDAIITYDSMKLIEDIDL
jgi:intein/homing endonuclease